MGFELKLFNGTFNNGLVQKNAVDEVLKCNNLTAQFGLSLTPNQAVALVNTRNISLKDNNRIEFGEGVIDKIIYEFCDSGYISHNNYEQTMHELIKIFYYYKNETFDLISDDDLIRYMKTSFEGICKGSTELLAGRELEKLAKDVRNAIAT